MGRGETDLRVAGQAAGLGSGRGRGDQRAVAGSVEGGGGGGEAAGDRKRDREAEARREQEAGDHRGGRAAGSGEVRLTPELISHLSWEQIQEARIRLEAEREALSFRCQHFGLVGDERAKAFDKLNHIIREIADLDIALHRLARET